VFATAGGMRGSEIESTTNGTQKTTGIDLGAGLGVGFEVERRGRLSFNPFLSARYTRLTADVDGLVPDSSVTTNGIVFAFGLGVRINDAIQITPSFNGSTFEGANLFFDLRASVALRFRK
jgi:hypothetical protein